MTQTGFTTIELVLSKNATILETAKYLADIGFDTRDAKPEIISGQTHVKFVVIDPTFKMAGFGAEIFQKFGTLVQVLHFQNYPTRLLLTAKQRKRLEELGELSTMLDSVQKKVEGLNLPPRFQNRLKELQDYVTACNKQLS